MVAAAAAAATALAALEAAASSTNGAAGDSVNAFACLVACQLPLAHPIFKASHYQAAAVRASGCMTVLASSQMRMLPALCSTLTA